MILDGKDITGLATSERSRNGLGRSFQDARLFSSLTVAETLACAFERKVKWQDPVSTVLGLPWVRTTERVVTSASTRSSRCSVSARSVTSSSRSCRPAPVGSSISRACLRTEPSVLLLDEPSSGIAQRETEALGPLLHRVKEATGCTMLLVEHDMPLVTSIADELIALETGRVDRARYAEGGYEPPGRRRGVPRDRRADRCALRGRRDEEKGAREETCRSPSEVVSRRGASGVVLVALVFAAAVLTFSYDPDTDLGAPVDAFRVVYSVEDFADEPVSFRTETLEVRRPYDGRLEGRPGLPPGGDITSGKVSNREYGWQLDDAGRLQFGLRRPPGGPTRDVSFRALLDAHRAGHVEMRGRGAALGRSCVWFAVADPFPALLKMPTDESRVEACVDPSGILLRETWTIDDRVVRVIEATVLDTDAPNDERFLIGMRPEEADVSQPEASDVLRQQIVVGDDVGGKGPALVLTAPRNWKRDRDAVVVQADASGRATQFSSVGYVDGPSLVIVERALKASYEPVWAWSEGDGVRMESAQRGRILYHPDRVELRVETDQGFARVFAPDRATAIAFAKRLRPR